MRANTPTDDFAVTQLLADVPDENKIAPEALMLAKIGSSPEWKIIEDYLDRRMDAYRQGLMGEDLKGVDTSIIGQRYLMSQQIIGEFEALKNEINITTKAVKDATKKTK